MKVNTMSVFRYAQVNSRRLVVKRSDPLDRHLGSIFIFIQLEESFVMIVTSSY